MAHPDRLVTRTTLTAAARWPSAYPLHDGRFAAYEGAVPRQLPGDRSPRLAMASATTDAPEAHGRTP